MKAQSLKNMGNLHPFIEKLLGNINIHHLLLKIQPMIFRGLYISRETSKSVLLIDICKHSLVFNFGSRWAADSVEQVTIQSPFCISWQLPIRRWERGMDKLEPYGVL